MGGFLQRNSTPLTIGIASRLLSVALIAVFGSQSTGGWPRLTDAASPFAAWDTQWFLSIAESGYHADPLLPIGADGYHDFAFFPAWPLLIRVASLGIIPLELTAIMLSNMLFVAAMVPTHRWLRRLTGDEPAATRGLVLLAFGPAAYVWSLGYSESLFLFLIGLAGCTMRDSIAAPAMVAVAQLTRLTGSALSVAAAARALRTHDMGWRTLAFIAAGPLAFLAWIGFVWMLTGEPTGYLQGSPNWYVLSATAAGAASLVEGLLAPSAYYIVSVVIVAAVVAGAIYSLRLDLEAGVYATLTVAATVLLANWVNMPRHALVALPAFAVLGAWLPSGRAGRLLIVLAVVGQVVLVTGAIRWASFPP
ncbi:MAG: mannosyltransferase family protein [Chloroflexota bacterium]